MKEMVRAEDVFGRRRREVEMMEDGIHWENKKHREIMKRIWESYRDRAEAENRRHEDSVTAIYEMYQERSSVHVKHNPGARVEGCCRGRGGP